MFNTTAKRPTFSMEWVKTLLHNREVTDVKFRPEDRLLRTLKADSHIACRAHAVPPPCRAAKGLECVFPI
jgi:hypothetical protein